MRIVIDSNNIVERDWNISGPEFAQLLSALPRCSHSLHVPQVVIDEVVAAYARKLSELLRDFVRARRDLGGLTGLSLGSGTEEIQVDQQALVYRERLLSRFREVGGEIMPIPGIPHDLLVCKAVERKKPFKEKAGDVVGYRDALIWESVLSLARREGDVVALVTKNWRDFGRDKGGTVLHEDLVEDLCNGGIPTDRVELYNGLSSFVDKHIRPILESDDDLRNLLRANTHPSLHLDEWIRNHGREIAWKAGEPRPREWPLVLFPHGPCDIRRVNDVVVRGVRILGPDRRDIELEATLEFGFPLSGYHPWLESPTSCETGCEVSVGTYDKYPRVEPDWEDPLGGATEWVWHRVELSLLFDTGPGEVQSFELKGSHKVEDDMETVRRGHESHQGDG